MKKILFLATVFVTSLFFSANAQQGGQREQREKMTPEQMATRTVERLNKEVTLTEKQQADLKKWYTTSYTERNKAMEKNKDNRDAMRESMKKDREATDAQLKKVLTAEQLKKYQDAEKKRQAARQNNGGQRGPGMRGQRPGQGAPRQGGTPGLW